MVQRGQREGTVSCFKVYPDGLKKTIRNFSPCIASIPHPCKVTDKNLT